MTNATTTLSVVFAASFLFAVAASWGGGSRSTAVFEEAVLPVDTSAVQAVRIDGPDAPTIRLDRSEEGWSVAPDEGPSYPASGLAVQGLFDALTALEVEAVPTRQADKHPRYGVDSTGTTVTMLGGDDEPLGQVIVGRTRMRQPQGSANQGPMQRMQRGRGTPVSYVRRPDRPDVYAVEQALQSVVDRSVEDWRDKQIWAVNRANIQRVDFRFPADSSFTMRRAAPRDTARAATPDTWVSAGDTLSSTQVSSVLRTLASPEADGFVTDATPERLGPARYEIQLHLRDGSTRTLRLRPGDAENSYVADADDFPYVVRLQRARWDTSVLQGRRALLQNG